VYFSLFLRKKLWLSSISSLTHNKLKKGLSQFRGILDVDYFGRISIDHLFNRDDGSKEGSAA
jgi:hypothetical protein